MRLFASLLVLVAAVIQLLLGTTYLLSARYEPSGARLESADRSLVASDVATGSTLGEEHRAAVAQPATGKLRPLLLGSLTVVLALVEVLGGVLLLLRRGRPLALAAIASGMVALGIVLVVDGLITIGLLALALLVFALVGTLLVALPARGSAHD